jgi:predicted hotdog family 3-hydroxylacyl-ACP dehydratase
MRDDFDRATERVQTCLDSILEEGVLPVIAADAAITQALAVWAADTGRHEDARAFLLAWTVLRDA